MLIAILAGLKVFAVLVVLALALAAAALLVAVGTYFAFRLFGVDMLDWDDDLAIAVFWAAIALCGIVVLSTLSGIDAYQKQAKAQATTQAEAK